MAALAGAVAGAVAAGPSAGADPPAAIGFTGAVVAHRTPDPPTIAAQAPTPQTLATGLDAPWDLAFMPDRRALVTERPGFIRLLASGRLAARARVPGVAARGDGGLLGVAIDPDFRRNRFVYLFRTTTAGNVVTRYRFARDRLSGAVDIVRGLRRSDIHNGGRIRFGPDRRLYVTTGDAGIASLAQSRSSRNGKILALGPRGYRGRGAGLQVQSSGHRNVQGLDWQPGTRRLVATEHGATGNDELNAIRRGQNYGWPRVQGAASQAGFVSPLVLYPEAIAPSGATFVKRPGSAWTGSYLVATLRGQHIRRISFDAGLRPTAQEVLFQGQFGRLRVVVEGPDGAIYALTSNTDSSRPAQGDRLLRITPPG